jgi:hypothetical protein
MLTVVGCGGSDVTTTTKKDTGVTETGPYIPPVGTVTVDKAALQFGAIDVGSTSIAQIVTVTVKGAAAPVNATVTGAGFAISATTCAAMQAIGSCTISVTFAPTIVGGANGALTAGGSSVSLSGAGTPVGQFSATPDRVELGTLLVNATASAVVTITPNTVGGVTGLTCIASGSDLTLATQTCAATGAITAPCTFTFTFKAATAGLKNDSVVCSGGGKTTTTTVAATVVTPSALSINPPSAPFTASVGETYVVTFNVSNSGGSPTGNLAATISAGATDFAITSNDCVVPLTALGVCKIQVTFKPTSATPAAKTGTLTVVDATVGSTPATAALTGTAIAASAVSITPNPSDFGTVEVGQTKTSTFTVKNTGGTATDAIVIGASSAEFVVDAALCNNLPLAPAATCAFTVAFKPALPAGAKSASVVVTQAGAAIASSQVTGTSKAAPALASLSVTPPTLDFGTIGVGTSKGPLALTVTNSGGTATGALTVVKKDSTSSVGGASQFTFTSPDCNGATLAPGASCTVAVTYAPTITGSASAILTISDGAVSSANGTVIGIALSIPTLDVSCTPAFDSTVVGQTSANVVCKIKNTIDPNGSGEYPQESGAITATVTGDFAIATNNCTASLQAQESCTLVLVFKPTVKGTRTGNLKVTSSNRGLAEEVLSALAFLPLQVDAYYTSSSGKFTKLAGTYDFGNVAMGADSDSSVRLTLAVYVHAQVGNFAISGTDLDFGNSNAIADFTGAAVSTSTTITGLGTSTHACASLTNTSTPPFGDSPYCFVTVDFTPNTKGAKTNAVTVSGANGTATDSVNMQGTGTGPLTINPSPLTFDAVAVGTTGVQTLSLTVKNSASSIGSNATLKIEGANAADFALVTDNISNQTLPSGGSPVYVPIRLTVPAGAAVGALTATVTVTATIAGVTETTTANLVGSAVTGAGISATLGGSFADTVVTGTSAAVKVTVKNNGALATDVLTVKLSGGNDFAVKLAATQASSCGDLSAALGNTTTYKLDPGVSCDFNVWFVPTAGLGVSKRNGTLTVSSTIGGMQVLTLSGNATGVLSITPATLDLGLAVINDPNPGVKTFTITNLGGSAINPTASLFNDIGQTGATSGNAEFRIKNNNCTTLGAAGSTSPLPSCTVDVNLLADDTGALTPKSLPGTRAATLKVTGALASGGTQAGTATAVVSGTAVKRAKLQFTALDSSVISLPSASLIDRDFGNVVQGTTSTAQTFVVTNVGGLDATQLAISFYELDSSGNATTTKHAKTSDLDLSGSTCVGDGSVVKAGQSCTIKVAFHPTLCAATATDCPYTTSNLGNNATNTTGYGVWMAVTATKGTEGESITANGRTVGNLFGAKLFGHAIDTNVANIVASTGLSAYDFGTTGKTTVFTLRNATTSAIPLTQVGTTTAIVATSIANSALSSGIAGAATEFAMDVLPAGTPVTKACSLGSVAAADYCLFAVTWTPVTTTKGTREVVLTVGGASINLFGRVLTDASLLAVPYPLAATTSSPVDFGNAVRGADSLVKTITILNVGELATTDDIKVVDGSDGAAGQVKVMTGTTCQGSGSALGSLQTCTVALAVHPTDSATTHAGVPVKDITLTTSAASLMRGGQQLLVSWQGVTGAILTSSPTKWSYDDASTYPGTGVLATTNSKVFTIANGGAPDSGPLSISISSADFYVDTDPANSTCLASALAFSGVTGGHDCTLQVFFSPTALATPAKTGTLTVKSASAPDLTVLLTGTAIPALKVDATAATGATFAPTTSSANASLLYPATSLSATPTTQTFTFTKATGSPATGLLMVMVAGANASEFKIVDDKCTGVSLTDVSAATKKCDVQVRFVPVSAVAGKKATLTVTDPTSGTPADAISVDLKGDGNP